MRPSFSSTSRTTRSGSPARARSAAMCIASPTPGASRAPLVTTLRSLGRQQARRLEADATGRTGDEADAVAQAEIHGWLA